MNFWNNSITIFICSILSGLGMGILEVLVNVMLIENVPTKYRATSICLAFGLSSLVG